MLVILDTNIIFQEDFFRSATVQNFLKACHLLGIHVAIPDVVYDEVLGNYEKELTQRIGKLRKAERELLSITENEAPSNIDHEEQMSLYEDFLGEMIEKYDIKLSDYPEIKHQDIIQASYSGKKPFKEKGEGYKDYLVWKTIEAMLVEQEEEKEIFFLTNNVKDFAEEDKEATSGFRLHTDLSSSLPNEDQSIDLFLNLNAFFKAKILPLLDGVEISKINHLSAELITNEVEKVILDTLPGQSFYGIEGLPFANEVYVDMVGAFNESNREIKKLDQDEFLIIVSGMIELNIDGFIDKGDVSHWYHLGDEPPYHVTDSNWNKHVMAVSTSIDTPCEVTLTYSKMLEQFVDNNVRLPDEIEAEEYW